MPTKAVKANFTNSNGFLMATKKLTQIQTSRAWNYIHINQETLCDRRMKTIYCRMIIMNMPFIWRVHLLTIRNRMGKLMSDFRHYIDVMRQTVCVHRIVYDIPQSVF